MNDWLQRAASWTWQNSLAAAVLAAVLLCLRVMLRGRVPPLWLCMGGALVMARLFLPAPLPNAWAWDGAWSRWVEAVSSSSSPVVPPLILASTDSSAPPLPAEPWPAVKENDGPREAPEAGAEWQHSDLEITQVTQGASLPSFAPIPSIPSVPRQSTTRDASRAADFNWQRTAAWLWAGGALLYFGLATTRHWRFVRRLRRTAQPAVLPWPGLASECARAAGLRGVPELLTIQGGGSPFLCGWLRPRIILPADTLVVLTESEARHVLLHEMLHAARHDLAINWLLAGVRSLHWFNPFVHLTIRRLLADRELLRDSQALALLRDGAERAAYGRTLLKLALTPAVPGLSPGFAPFFRSEKELKRRLTMIHSPLHSRRIASVAAAVCLTTLGAWLFTTARAQPPPSAGEPPAAPSPVTGLPPVTVPAPAPLPEDPVESGPARIAPPIEIAAADAGAPPAFGEPVAAPDAKAEEPETVKKPAGLPKKAVPFIKAREAAAEEAARAQLEAAKQHRAAAQQHMLELQKQIAASATEAEKQKLLAEARAHEAEAKLQAAHAAAVKHDGGEKSGAIENLRNIAAGLRKEGRKDEATAIDAELDRLTKSTAVPIKFPAAPEDARGEIKQLRAEMAEVRAALAALQKHQSGELDELSRRTMELKKMMGGGFGPKHPKVQAMEAEIAEYKKLFSEGGSQLMQEIQKGADRKSADTEAAPQKVAPSKKAADPVPRAEAATEPDQPGSNLPWGVPVPGKYGIVWSPFAPEKGVVDVSGHGPKTVVKCPYTGSFFYVPQLPKAPQMK